MSKSKQWASFDEALSMFELNFRIERDQGIQECRELLNVFAELDASFTPGAVSKAATDVKKPLRVEGF